MEGFSLHSHVFKGVLSFGGLVGRDEFLYEVSLDFLKVWSLSLTSGFAHAISHPLENDFPRPLSILFRNARILFFSLYKEEFKAK